MNLRTPREIVLALLLTAVLGGAPAVGAGTEEHGHEPLRVDPSLSIEDVVETSLAAYPGLAVLDARQGEADAWSRRGRGLLGDQPSVLLRYQSDRWGADTGLDEYEAGVELPLWRWGGRSAVQAYSKALASESEAAARALRWEVAGIVRTALWDVALAENARGLAEQSLAGAARLVAAVERRYELGDVAARDLLLARSSYLQYQSALIEAEAALADAERTYSAYTGLERRPEFETETLSPTTGVSAQHPALALADQALASAQANVAVVSKTVTGGPTVTLGTRRERPAFGTSFDESVGVALSVPFGGAATRDTAIASASREVADATALRGRHLRELTLALHEAAHSLAVVRDNLVVAEQNVEIAERQLAMGEIAYEQGEVELLDLLKIKETTVEARRQLARLRIELQRQTAFYNQAVGEVP